MANIAAINSTEEKTFRTSDQNTCSSCSICWCKSSNNDSGNQLFTHWKGL